MEQQKCLGIYISANNAVGIVLEGHAGHYKVLACCSAQTGPDDNLASIAAAVTDQITQKKLQYDEASVAVDCSLYTQHQVHSEFTDHRLIANTIRFDAEEAIATDATQLAVTFDTTSSDETGSEVTVYTAKRDMMTDMLKSMIQNGLDPVAVEPDIVCLGRFIEKNNIPLADRNRLFVVISESSCYLIIPSEDPHHAPSVRSFLMSKSQDINTVLAREIPITIASMSGAMPVNTVAISGNTGDIDKEQLFLKTGLEVDIMDLAEKTGAQTTHCPDQVKQYDFAIAYGAALSQLARTQTTDFRKDFMPYEGRKRVIQSALRIFSIAATIIIISIGANFQKTLIQTKKQNNQIKQKLYKETSEVIFGKTYNPENEKRKFSSMLATELRKVKTEKSGLSYGDDSSVTARLTFLLEAINESQKNNDIKIKKITIRPNRMSVNGTTANKSYTNDLIRQIDKHKKLKKDSVTAPPTAGESTFTINIDLK